jgi:DNA-binding transcriptional ArsR family regulator
VARFNGAVVLDDPLSLRILTFLAGRYLPVMSEWIEAGEIAAALSVPAAEVERRLQALLERGLVEFSPADEENEQAAALITVKGLLAIGRVP